MFYQFILLAGYLLSVFSLNTMGMPDTHSIKQAFNKWLIALALLASVFAFSGLSTSPHDGPLPVQSAWIIRGSKPIVGGIQFSTCTHHLSTRYNVEFAGCSIVNLSLLHSKISAVKLKHCQYSGLAGSYKMLTGVRKTIPQNGKAEPAPVLA